jgi:hypothetical protein
MTTYLVTLPSYTEVIFTVIMGIVVALIIVCVVKTRIDKKIIEKLKEQKTPLWFLVAIVAYSLPIAVLIVMFPLFGGMQYQLCQLSGAPVCSFPPNNMWVITEGLTWAMFLDLVLIIWAYLTWKFDYLVPWLERKFGKKE